MTPSRSKNRRVGIGVEWFSRAWRERGGCFLLLRLQRLAIVLRRGIVQVDVFGAGLFQCLGGLDGVGCCFRNFAVLENSERNGGFCRFVHFSKPFGRERESDHDVF